MFLLTTILTLFLSLFPTVPYTYVLVLKKKQWHRTLDKAKQLIDHIQRTDTKHLSTDSIVGNCYSFMGIACFELGRMEKALEYHLDDLQVSSQW